jgi:PAS domain S-box-containing protein
LHDLLARIPADGDWRLLLLAGAAAVAGLGAAVGFRLGRRQAPRRDTALSRLREAMDVMPEGLAFFDADDRAVIWNARYSELNSEGGSRMEKGVPFRELLEIGLAIGHYPDAVGRETEWLDERMALHLAARSTHEQKLADGRWFRIEERRTADGGVLSVIEDITDLKQREETLQLMFANNPVPIWIRSAADKRVLDVNQAAVDHYGYSREQFLRMSLLDIFAPEEHADLAEATRTAEETGSYDSQRAWRHRTADGREILARHYVRAISYRGEPALMAAQFDVTASKQAEAALAAARDQAEAANRAKSEFLANMSHEIRTPLNGVTGVAQVLSRTPLSPQQQEMVQVIEQSAATLERLLSDVLDLARVESGRVEIQIEPFELGASVRAVAALTELRAEHKGVQFKLDIAPEAEGVAEGDAGRLKQILFNLLSNALKFTTAGHVLLRVTVDDAAEPPRFRFEVEDTGVGFDPETKDKLFQRFEQADGSITRKFGGTGLGLAISRDLAELMGGTLDASAEPGKGAVFVLELPMVRRSTERPIEEPLPEFDMAPQENLRVLLADDHETNRKVVELMVAAIGCDLTCVEDGEEAVQAVLTNRFDVVLMDMQMPVMDGLTAIRAIRAHEAETGAPRTRIFTLSANAMQEHERASAEAGADRHLTKPITAAVLLGALAEVAQEKAALAA